MLGIVAVLVLAAPPVEAESARLHGTATYRERIALPADAVFEAVLLDVSRAAAPAIELGRARVENPGFPPFRFEIVYDAARIEPRHVYVVRATIRAAGRVIFATDRAYPVLSDGSQSRLEMLLVRESAAERAPRRPAHGVVFALEGTRWKLVQVGGRDVVVRGRGREPFLVLEARPRHASGSGGCNRFTGTYDSGPRTLRFGPLVVTRMACDGMRTEQAYLRALAATRRWRIEGAALVLMDGQNRVLARFEARGL
jgi:putative lipoprotein